MGSMWRHNQCAMSFLFHIAVLASLQELTLFLKPRRSNNHVRPCHPSPENYARLPPVQSVLRPEVVRFHIYLGRHRCASHNPIHTFTASCPTLTPTCQNNDERREKKEKLIEWQISMEWPLLVVPRAVRLAGAQYRPNLR